MKRILVAMSGGVDSSVAAWLLLQQGYECVGATMKLLPVSAVSPSGSRTCCSLEDIEDARSVAYRLGIPYHVFDFSQEFEEKVIRKFADTYQRGGTPNPCIDCNRYLKFDRLLRRARALGCDGVATGHYARIRWTDGRWSLCKGSDGSRDQSYVLCSLTQDQLAHTLFPLGGLHKDQVRAIAAEQGLCNARKRDSQDLCFVPGGDYVAFLERYTGQPCRPGPILDRTGRVLGAHRGTAAYTIGQRRGLGLAMPEPVYVCALCPAENTVIVGAERDLYASALLAEDWNWIAAPPGAVARANAKIRYRQVEQPVSVTPLPDGGVRLEFDAPQRAVTPGQTAAVYHGDMLLGGGTITRVLY